MNPTPTVNNETRDVLSPRCMQIQVLKDYINEITDEFNRLELIKLDDWRSDDWYLAPLKLEAEDAGVFAEEDIKNFKQQCPTTVSLMNDFRAIACSFGSLDKHSTIAPHTHDNPYVTHILTLQAQDCSIEIEGETYQLNAGEIISFDYRPMHAVYNKGDVPWNWLMLLG